MKILLVIATYLISTGISYLFFSQSSLAGEQASSPTSLPVTSKDSGVLFDDTLPKTEPCPLNGAKYSKQQKEWWGEHRPLGIMIENHEEARPQSGLSSSDVVYEAVAEGGITRFLAVFYCQDAPYIGPIRSARTYYLDWLSEYGSYPLYSHVGGANTPGPANAMGQIEDYGWYAYNDLSQFSIGCPVYCQLLHRLGNGNIAIEHTMYSSTTKLWDFAKEKRNLTNKDKDGELWDEGFVPYEFKEDAQASKRPAKQGIHLEFWNNDPSYFVDWEYDPATNLYKRKNAAVVYTDKNNGEQLTAKNVVVLSMIERNANDGYENNLHLLYRNKGSGKATIFMDGTEIKGTWKKDNRTSRTLLFDALGNRITFNRGTIWFEILPTTGVLTVN